MFADLHIHTVASDGTDSISDLVRKIQNAQISAFSVTDHDTISAAVAIEEILPDGIQYIKGVEFSCITPIEKCHILGYGYNPEDSALNEVLECVVHARVKKLKDRIVFLEDRFGISLTENEKQWLWEQNSPGKPHLAQILIKRGMVPDVQTAIDQYIGLHKSSEYRISAKTAIEAIRHSGGIAVWAHPLGGEGENRLSLETFEAQLSELISYGIQGLECYYSRYDETEIKLLLQKADRHQLLVSGGSDYHGRNKPDLQLGMLCSERISVDFQKLSILR